MLVCPVCGYGNSEANRFCVSCGSGIDIAEEQPQAGPSSPPPGGPVSFRDSYGRGQSPPPPQAPPRQSYSAPPPRQPYGAPPPRPAYGAPPPPHQRYGGNPHPRYAVGSGDRFEPVPSTLAWIGQGWGAMQQNAGAWIWVIIASRFLQSVTGKAGEKLMEWLAEHPGGDSAQAAVVLLVSLAGLFIICAVDGAVMLGAAHVTLEHLRRGEPLSLDRLFIYGFGRLGSALGFMLLFFCLYIPAILWVIWLVVLDRYFDADSAIVLWGCLALIPVVVCLMVPYRLGFFRLVDGARNPVAALGDALRIFRRDPIGYFCFCFCFLNTFVALLGIFAFCFGIFLTVPASEAAWTIAYMANTEGPEPESFE